VTRGSISFNGVDVTAPAGIRIPAGAVHAAMAGQAGVECVEAFEGDG
jgi:mannose-6-phosphate isomerase class I